jgi:hypothetical protein
MERRNMFSQPMFRCVPNQKKKPETLLSWTKQKKGAHPQSQTDENTHQKKKNGKQKNKTKQQNK